MESLKSNAEWKLWGQEDPLHGVAAWAGKDKDGPSAWTDAEFYALGESDWRDFLSHWHQYGIEGGTCVEIGCGAGRTNHAPAGYFERMKATDVSEGMIEHTRRAVGPNVEFFLVESTDIPVADSSASAVFSCHVLQHLDSDQIGYQYFKEAFRVLKPGCSLMIHIPLYQFPNERGPWRRVWSPLYRYIRLISSVKADLDRRRKIKTMRGTPYSIEGLRAFLLETGFRNVEYRIFPTNSNQDLHSFVLATK